MTDESAQLQSSAAGVFQSSATPPPSTPPSTAASGRATTPPRHPGRPREQLTALNAAAACPLSSSNCDRGFDIGWPPRYASPQPFRSYPDPPPFARPSG